MALPKTMSDSLIKRLNEACAAFVDVCDRERDCDDLGWCEACWIAASESPGQKHKTNESRSKAPF